MVATSLLKSARPTTDQEHLLNNAQKRREAREIKLAAELKEIILHRMRVNVKKHKDLQDTVTKLHAQALSEDGTVEQTTVGGSVALFAAHC